MRKIACMLVVIIMMTSIFCGCNSNKPEDEGTTAANTKIKVSVFYEEKEQGKIYKNLAKAYMDANPGTNVEIEYAYSNRDDMTKVLSDDGGIDIMGLTRSQLLEFSKSGYLKDLSSLSKEMDYKNSLYPVCLSYGTYNGKLYGIGDMPSTVEWFYNKDIFDKYNLSEPKNLEELKTVCKTLSKNGVIPLSLGGMEGWPSAVILSSITSQTSGSSDFTNNYGSDKQAFSSIKGIESSFEILGELFSSGCIDKQCGKINYIQSIKDFVKGDAAILPALSTAQETIKSIKGKSFNYGVLENGITFTSSPESLYSATAIQTLAIPENSKNSAAAEEFLKFIFSEEGQKYFTDEDYVAALKSSNTDNDAVKQEIYNHLNLTNDDSIMLYDNVSPDMLTNLDAILENVADGIVNAKDAWNKILTLTFPD